MISSTTKRSAQRPIIIIGAPRSGTNMLRNVLTSLPGIGTWPCDEINYIWRHGHAKSPTDEFRPDQATEPVRRYVRGEFDSLARRRSLDWIVEKTCANSLRVDYVHHIFPDARFVFLIRDGRDSIASAAARWTRRPGFIYLLRKARFVPATDLPVYATRFLHSQIHRALSREKRWASWGPRFEGIDEALRTLSTVEICAAQWSRCVKRAMDASSRIPRANHCHVRYEDFVSRPADELSKLLEFLELSARGLDLSAVTCRVTQGNVGKWRSSFDDRAMNRITAAYLPLLRDLGYGDPSLDVTQRRAA